MKSKERSKEGGVRMRRVGLKGRVERGEVVGVEGRVNESSSSSSSDASLLLSVSKRRMYSQDVRREEEGVEWRKEEEGFVKESEESVSSGGRMEREGGRDVKVEGF